MDGSPTIGEGLLPVAERAAREDRSMPLLTTALAAWLEHVRRHAEPATAPLLDARADRLIEIVRGWTPASDAARDRAVITQLMGDALGADDDWVRNLGATTRAIQQRGVEAVLDETSKR